MEYMITLQAGNYYNNVVVPIYDSLGENAVEYIVKHAGVELIFVDVAKLPQLTKVLPRKELLSPEDDIREASVTASVVP